MGRSGNSVRFDSAAATWDDDPVRVRMAAAVFEGIAGRVVLTGDMAAIDIGCGTGLISLPLAGVVRSVVAVDSSPVMLKVLADKAARAGLSNISTAHIDVDGDFTSVGTFDVVTCVMVLHHISDVPEMLRSVSAIMASGASVALVDLYAEDGAFHSDPRAAAHNGFNPADVAIWMRAAGIAPEEPVTVHTVIRTDEYSKATREYPMFLLVGHKI